MADKYTNYKELAAAERENIDFRIRSRLSQSRIAMVAAHGGGIEPGTSEIADALAGDDLSLYIFEGLKPDRNRDLHITSTQFDESRCLSLIATSRFVVTIHGESGSDQVVYVGGRDAHLAGAISSALRQ